MSESNSGLVDIIEPAVPMLVASTNWLWLALLAAVVVALFAALLLWWKYKLPAYRAVQRVRELHKKLHAAAHTQHETVLLLALELRHGLVLKRLRADILPERCTEPDQARWVEFMQHLDSLLYQPEVELTTEKMSAMFVHIEYWLQRYSRKSTLKKIGS